MLYYFDGDLLKSDCTFLLHQCNCYKNLGAGIAYSIALSYPEAAQADKDFPHSSDIRFGMFSYALATNESRAIINLYGQKNYGNSKKSGIRYTQHDKLRSAIDSFLNDIPKININNMPVKIGLPYLMGCDLAGGDWNIVIKDLEEFSNKYNYDFYIYKYDKAKK